MSDTNIELPAHLRNNDEAAKRALADAASMASSSNSVPRISLRGREFRLIENGEEVRKVRDKLRVIILGVEPEAGRMIKTFYKDGYKQGAKEPPTCSSSTGVAPDPWVQNKQHTNCGQCPKNVFGSATSPSGKQTKACRDSKQVWVAMADDPKPLDERTQYGMNVTVASLKAFAEHGRKLAGIGQAPCVAITELEMLDTEFPQLAFHLVGWVDEPTMKISLDIASKRPWAMFRSALALSNEGESSATVALPMQLPSHLQGGTSVIPPAQTIVQQAQPATAPTPPVSSQQIDDAVGNW